MLNSSILNLNKLWLNIICFAGERESRIILWTFDAISLCVYFDNNPWIAVLKKKLDCFPSLDIFETLHVDNSMAQYVFVLVMVTFMQILSKLQESLKFDLILSPFRIWVNRALTLFFFQLVYFLSSLNCYSGHPFLRPCWISNKISIFTEHCKWEITCTFVDIFITRSIFIPLSWNFLTLSTIDNWMHSSKMVCICEQIKK